MTIAVTAGAQLVGFMSLFFGERGDGATDLSALREVAMTLGGAVVAMRAAERHAAGVCAALRAVGVANAAPAPGGLPSAAGRLSRHASDAAISKHPHGTPPSARQAREDGPEAAARRVAGMAALDDALKVHGPAMRSWAMVADDVADSATRRLLIACSAFRCASRERELRGSRSLFYSRLTHTLAVFQSVGLFAAFGIDPAAFAAFVLSVEAHMADRCGGACWFPRFCWASCC